MRAAPTPRSLVPVDQLPRWLTRSPVRPDLKTWPRVLLSQTSHALVASKIALCHLSWFGTRSEKHFKWDFTWISSIWFLPSLIQISNSTEESDSERWVPAKREKGKPQFALASPLPAANGYRQLFSFPIALDDLKHLGTIAFNHLRPGETLYTPDVHVLKLPYIHPAISPSPHFHSRSWPGCWTIWEYSIWVYGVSHIRAVACSIEGLRWWSLSYTTPSAYPGEEDSAPTGMVGGLSSPSILGVRSTHFSRTSFNWLWYPLLIFSWVFRLHISSSTVTAILLILLHPFQSNILSSNSQLVWLCVSCKRILCFVYDQSWPNVFFFGIS